MESMHKNVEYRELFLQQTIFSKDGGHNLSSPICSLNVTTTERWGLWSRVDPCDCLDQMTVAEVTRRALWSQRGKGPAASPWFSWSTCPCSDALSSEWAQPVHGEVHSKESWGLQPAAPLGSQSVADLPAVWTAIFKEHPLPQWQSMEPIHSAAMSKVNSRHCFEPLHFGVIMKQQFVITVGHLMGRANSLRKTPMLEKVEGRRRRVGHGWVTEQQLMEHDYTDSFLFCFHNKITSELAMTHIVVFSRSVTSSSLRPHGLQHARLPCPSSTPGDCSNARPLSWWCHLTTSSSVVPFSSCPRSFITCL